MKDRNKQTLTWKFRPKIGTHDYNKSILDYLFFDWSKNTLYKIIKFIDFFATLLRRLFELTGR